MATAQEKATFMTKNTPVHNHEQEQDIIDDYEDTVSPSGCDCFGSLSFNWRRNNGIEHRHLLHPNGEYRESLWVTKLKKLKEISESFAGPKFKTFIRKISKNKKQKNNFHYDSYNYALNFDSGGDSEDRGFSTRFAAPFLDDRRQAESGL